MASKQEAQEISVNDQHPYTSFQILYEALE